MQPLIALCLYFLMKNRRKECRKKGKFLEQKEYEVSFTLHIVSWIECKYQEYRRIKSTIIIARQGFNICSNCFNWLHFNSFLSPFFLPSVSSSFLPWYSFFQFTSLSFHSSLSPWFHFPFISFPVFIVLSSYSFLILMN